jgi:hypothetical protein
MLAAFGELISGSATGVVLAVVGATALGGWLDRVRGALLGSICGALAVAFGALVSGTTTGVVFTISAGVILGGWLRWDHEQQVAERQAEQAALLAARLAAVPSEDAAGIGRQSKGPYQLSALAVRLEAPHVQ